MIDLLTGLEATGLAQHLRASRWTYPLVNAGHVFGIALLVGAVIPMDLRILGLLRGPDPGMATDFLRPVAAAGLALTAICGALLFIAQPTDYATNGWFQIKMALLAAALLNAALHIGPAPPRHAAAASLALWPAVLLSGRLIAYS